MTRKFVTIEHAAEHCAVTPRTIRNWISRGVLTAYRAPSSRVIRLDLHEVDRAMRPVPAARARA